MDTIFALATAPGKSGVAIIRLSGPGAVLVAERVAGSVPPPRQAGLRMLRDAGGAVLDEALVLYFPAGQSFTGEDVVEFQTHGSPAVYRAVLRTLSALEGLRLADPGEFTRRALENGRMDLAQIEGLADLIEAETEAQRRQAVAVFSGELSEVTEAWRQKLIRAAALLEATIDFADEEVPVDMSPEVTELLASVRGELAPQIAGVTAAERIRDGYEVAIIGRPNVGKSTLLNRLAGREAAITSEFAGTTRDIIEVRMDLNGLPVTLLDTAGLRDAEDAVEGMGIARALERAAAADLRVFLLFVDEAPVLVPQDGDIVLQAKADLSGGQGISGKTGQGVDALIAQITDILEQRSAGAGLAIRERHATALRLASSSLEAATGLVGQGPDLYDLAAEELRSGIRALDSVIGRVDVESVLDEIFASFCLGK